MEATAQGRARWRQVVCGVIYAPTGVTRLKSKEVSQQIHRRVGTNLYAS